MINLDEWLLHVNSNVKNYDMYIILHLNINQISMAVINE